MTRWVTEEPCEFPKIKESACGSSEEWTRMLNLRLLTKSICPKNVFYDRWAIIADPTRVLGLLTLSATTWRPQAGEEKGPLRQLRTKLGKFQIWKRKLFTWEFAYYLDHWSESYSWFLCRKYAWANLRSRKVVWREENEVKLVFLRL